MNLPVVDVCVTSYKRPELLERLLRALFAQETGGRFRFTVNVVDNDAAGSGAAVVRRLAAEGHDVRCDIEPVQNISLGRNRSVSLSDGEWIATTDDDLLPDTGWLATLLRAATELEADVVHGQTIHRFLPGTPDYVREFHHRPCPATGATSGYIYNTGNVLFRRSLIAGNPAPFDPELGRTGGEDTAFFNALRDGGHRLVWCAEAVVWSDVPAHRSTLRWILQRRFRHGTTASRILGPLLTARSTWTSLRSIAILAFVSAVYAVLSPFRRRWREKARRRFVSMLLYCSFLAGRIAAAANFRYEEYKAARISKEGT